MKKANFKSKTNCVQRSSLSHLSDWAVPPLYRQIPFLSSCDEAVHNKSFISRSLDGSWGQGQYILAIGCTVHSLRHPSDLGDSTALPITSHVLWLGQSPQHKFQCLALYAKKTSKTTVLVMKLSSSSSSAFPSYISGVHHFG